eukprot:sb/3462401/
MSLNQGPTVFRFFRNFKHFFRIFCHFCRVEQSGKTGRFPAPRRVLRTAALENVLVYLCVGILFWLSRLCFLANLVKPKFYGLPKLWENFKKSNFISFFLSHSPLDGCCYSNAKGDKNVDLLHLVCISLEISKPLCHFAKGIRVKKYNCSFDYNSLPSKVIRPFSALLSTTYNENGFTHPAARSIDNDVATFAEAHLNDTASWLLTRFSDTDVQVKEVTLVLLSTAGGRNADDVRFGARLMTDAVVYVVDSAEKKHQCGTVQLNLDDHSPLDGCCYSNAKGDKNVDLLHLVCISLEISKPLCHFAKGIRVKKYNCSFDYNSLPSKVIRPFSALLSTTYNENGFTHPAARSIDNDVATFAEAHLNDTASWLLTRFSDTDVQVKEVTLVLLSTAGGRNADDVRFGARLMTDAVVYVVDSAEKKHQCGTVQLNLDDQLQSDPDLVTPDLVTPRFSDRINFPRYRKLTVFYPDLVATPIYYDYHSPLDGCCYSNAKGDKNVDLLHLVCISLEISKPLCHFAKGIRVKKYNCSFDYNSLPSKVIRPFSALLSTTYNENGFTHPAARSIDNDVATFAEAHLNDTASWLLTRFSDTDVQVKEVTLVLLSTAGGRNADDVRFGARLMTDAVVYVVDSAEKKHQCGTVQLNLDDVSAEGQTYSWPCEIWGSQIRVESSAGTIEWDGTQKNKHILVAECTVSVLHSQTGKPTVHQLQSDPDLVTPDLVTPRFSDRINFPRYRKLTVFYPDLVATPI